MGLVQLRDDARAVCATPSMCFLWVPHPLVAVPPRRGSSHKCFARGWSAQVVGSKRDPSEQIKVGVDWRVAASGMALRRTVPRVALRIVPQMRNAKHLIGPPWMVIKITGVIESVLFTARLLRIRCGQVLQGSSHKSFASQLVRNGPLVKT